LNDVAAGVVIQSNSLDCYTLRDQLPGFTHNSTETETASDA